MSTGELYAQVIVASPLPQLNRAFSYRVPDHLRSTIRLGCRVKVPMRKSLSNGYVVLLSTTIEFEGTLQDIEEVVSSVPILSADLLELARQISSRYVSSVHEVLRLAIPTRQVRVEKKWWGEHSHEFDAEPVQTVAVSEELELPHLEFSRDGLVYASLAEPDRQALSQPSAKILWQPTPGAESIPRWCREISEIAQATVHSGQSVIIVLPDFRDIENVETAIRHDLESEDLRILRFDSNQSNQARYTNYLESLREQPAIILGNRSAILAPITNVGTIIVWEESDPLHIEQMAPYYSSRDAALLRANISQSRLIFAGLSTSYALERLVSMQWLHRIKSFAPRPTIIDAAGEDVARGFRIPSQVMTAIGEALKKKGAVLLQVAKPTRAATEFPDDALATVSQTGRQLGQSFPGVRVIVADGDQIVQHVTEPGVIVVGTRGAEPVHELGYDVVALLDGNRMLGRESLDVVEDTMRWWLTAASLANATGRVFTNGLPMELTQSLMIWQPERFIQRDLEHRKTLRLPPYIRLASIRGSRVAVQDTKRKLAAITDIDEMIVDPADPVDEVELYIKINYHDAPAVTEIMRAQILKYAAGSGKKRLRLRIRFLDSGREL